MERMYLRTLGHPDLADFRQYLRLTSTELDSTLNAALMAAVSSAEHYIGRYIYPSDIVVEIPFSRRIVLRGPVDSIDSVVVDGTALEEGGYSFTLGVLELPDEVSGRVARVAYRAGMMQVPYDIAAAILLHATALFNNPSDSVETLPKASMNLLRPYRTYGVDPFDE